MPSLDWRIIGDQNPPISLKNVPLPFPLPFYLISLPSSPFCSCANRPSSKDHFTIQPPFKQNLNPSISFALYYLFPLFLVIFQLKTPSYLRLSPYSPKLLSMRKFYRFVFPIDSIAIVQFLPSAIFNNWREKYQLPLFIFSPYL